MKPLPELMSFLEGLPEPHILFDTQYRILAANAAYRRQFSPLASVIGRTCYEVSHHFSVPCDQAGESCPLARSRESGQRERVLHLLRRLGEHAGIDGTIWLPRREEIGAMLDMTFETASRLVSAMRREGVLTLAPGRSAVLDRAALRKALLAEGAA